MSLLQQDDTATLSVGAASTPESAPAECPAEATAKPPWWACLQEDVSCVLERDPAARSQFEVWTIYPGIQAVALYRMAHALWQRGWRYMPRWLSFFARWLTNIDIHPGAQIGRRFFIDHGAGVVIGETAVIGHDVTLYHGVTLGGTTWRAGKRHPTLEDGVVVGAGAKILGAIKVGARARVAANSVVIDPVPAAATVVGIPGRIVIRKEPPAASIPTAQSAPTTPLANNSQLGIALDLNHHLIPDPVGKAIACLLDRIAALETQLDQLKQTNPTQLLTPNNRSGIAPNTLSKPLTESINGVVASLDAIAPAAARCSCDEICAHNLSPLSSLTCQPRQEVHHV